MDACLGSSPTGWPSQPPSVVTPSSSVLSSCPSDTYSGHGGAATPATDGPAAATEWTWDAADNGDTDLNVPTVD